jgi:hypothetical protein
LSLGKSHTKNTLDCKECPIIGFHAPLKKIPRLVFWRLLAKSFDKRRQRKKRSRFGGASIVENDAVEAKVGIALGDSMQYLKGRRAMMLQIAGVFARCAHHSSNHIAIVGNKVFATSGCDIFADVFPNSP